MKRFLVGVAALAAFMTSAVAQNPDPKNWEDVLGKAKGQTVYWNAWGGSENINAYIEWAGQQIKERHGVNLVHVKLSDTANAVNKVVAEKAAGKNEGGSVDLIWINGENFASMKRQNLLFSPDWATSLPNWQFVNHENIATITRDYTTPTDGLESPWGGAKLVFFYDGARVGKKNLPDSAKDLLTWAKENKGRFSYPKPRDFMGTTFLKQALLELTDDRAKFKKAVNDETFKQDTAALFAYLDELHPNLWRAGKDFPKNYPDMKQKMADNELDIIFSFNPSEASAAIAAGELPDTVRSFVFSKGTLGNTHFVAIPYNATAKAGGLVLANFLISPEAQFRKQNPENWGDPTVLSMDKVPAEYREKFANLDLGVATLKPAELGPVLPELHPDWMERIEAEWLSRYGVQN